jgi:phosphonate transport system substrate-binding protein
MIAEYPFCRAAPDRHPGRIAHRTGAQGRAAGRVPRAAPGREGEYTPVTDYAAAVEALANQQVDLAWFGGFTFVQALQRSGGKVVPLVQREEDEKFRSVFITTDDAIKSSWPT